MTQNMNGNRVSRRAEKGERDKVNGRKGRN